MNITLNKEEQEASERCIQEVLEYAKEFYMNGSLTYEHLSKVMLAIPNYKTKSVMFLDKKTNKKVVSYKMETINHEGKMYGKFVVSKHF